jgi:hypothetical protein
MLFVAALSRFLAEYRLIMEQARTGKAIDPEHRTRTRKG